MKSGNEITFVCEGPDEEAALAAMVKIVEDGLGKYGSSMVGNDRESYGNQGCEYKMKAIRRYKSMYKGNQRFCRNPDWKQPLWRSRAANHQTGSE